jgi:hypothetical protein
MILEPIHSSYKLDPTIQQSIIQEIRLAVKNAIIQARELNVGFDDLDFVVDDFLDFDLPDEEYSEMRDACNIVAFNEFNRIMGHMKEAFGVYICVEGME